MLLLMIVPSKQPINVAIHTTQYFTVGNVHLTFFALQFNIFHPHAPHQGLLVTSSKQLQVVAPLAFIGLRPF